ncbi:MAG: phosphoribosyltransferase [Spirochaetaceae bacterium]|nr:MAG: phosphoribosyltransferase [Spirochaetaceae bacterium]
MKKEFIPYNTIRDNALKLANRIYLDGFIPDVIYVSLRGGAYLGNVISEYFKLVRKDQRPVFFAAVVARSYTDIYTNQRVMVDGWTYSPEHLRSGDRVLLVDDIFDTGRTINHLIEIILEKGIPREDIKIAVHDYKLRDESNSDLPIHPDYYCRKFEIAKDGSDAWLHYMSHELVGLTKEEIIKHYPEDLHETLISAVENG